MPNRKVLGTRDEGRDPHEKFNSLRPRCRETQRGKWTIATTEHILMINGKLALISKSNSTKHIIFIVLHVYLVNYYVAFDLEKQDLCV